MADADALGVLFLAPTRKDAAAGAALLKAAGLACRTCASLAELCGQVAGGVGVAVVPEEAVFKDRAGVFADILRGQPPWSNLPVLVLTAPGRLPDARVQALLELGDVTLLKRPLETAVFLNAVRAALRDRRRQYQVRDYLAEQERQAEALREADRKKNDFIALLAHELRNPLAPIRSGLRTLHLSADPAVRARAQAVMERQLGHMVRMIDDLLDVSRIGRHKMELRRARLALADAVASAVETARPAIDEAGHELRVDLPDAPVFLDADPTRLSQVFSNLLANSAKYTQPGGRIWLTAERQAGTVRVSVRDTGTGIPADALPTVFDLFSQVDRPLERNSGGLGIGLALVKGLVEMHGGTVVAASDGLGKGSTFTVTLPVSAVEERRTPPAAAEVVGIAGRRVLLADDSRDGREMLEMLLQLLGADVRTAGDGEEAVAEAERFRPHLILMDVGMPRCDGLEATRRIRAHPWGHGIRIVALTGWGQELDRERTRQAGCDGHLVKPVEPSDLERLFDKQGEG